MQLLQRHEKLCEIARNRTSIPSLIFNYRECITFVTIINMQSELFTKFLILLFAHVGFFFYIISAYLNHIKIFSSFFYTGQILKRYHDITC